MADGDVLTLVAGHQAFAAPSGGGSIAATDKQIVFMDGTDAVGSPDLTWDAVEETLCLGSGENDHAFIVGGGVGTELQIRAADGDATHVGGEMLLASGDSAGQSGGALSIVSGSDSGGGDAGPLGISSGFASDGASGDIDIRVGPNGDSATGGTINIWAGTGQTGSGGNITIYAGPKLAGGSHGNVQIYSGDSSSSLNLNTDGVYIAGATINMAGLPATDPLVAGQLYTDGTPGAGDPKPLMVSGGPP